MPATRWRAPPADGLRIVPLDDIVAIYHRASATTHLVVSPVPELLDELAGRWRTADEIEAAFDLVDGGRDALIARLDELGEAGLVEAA
ncbi:HPr-rel-A system PqqD family peptide chaperone [Sphingomonas sp. SUN019]|uniref:HPr-rel-A system PqqD family peptide chaperone n=1 Tax=Sphingomonas sp. SUN019 TaxID=2937788 RepID=UPI002164E0A5|nr:HPr-rel-A system PqqD family peptide chaperone [Sphingomonas sp. SUN019]UVO52097.1 HPr-rel-A system PqqD family peptide chaperone [Sphingomonas sp. SUN019]